LKKVGKKAKGHQVYRKHVRQNPEGNEKMGKEGDSWHLEQKPSYSIKTARLAEKRKLKAPLYPSKIRTRLPKRNDGTGNLRR